MHIPIVVQHNYSSTCNKIINGKKEEKMWFRPSFIYLDIYYDHTLSLRRQVINEEMDIPEREREIGGYREE